MTIPNFLKGKNNNITCIFRQLSTGQLCFSYFFKSTRFFFFSWLNSTWSYIFLHLSTSVCMLLRELTEYSTNDIFTLECKNTILYVITFPIAILKLTSPCCLYNLSISFSCHAIKNHIYSLNRLLATPPTCFELRLCGKSHEPAPFPFFALNFSISFPHISSLWSPL